MKIIVFILIITLLVSVGIFIFIKEHKANNSLKYQGPVPQGYDETYFRDTGITKKVVN